MALVILPFQQAIADALGVNEEGMTPEAKAGINKTATNLAAAIDAYIRSQTITVATTGTAAAQAGTGIVS